MKWFNKIFGKDGLLDEKYSEDDKLEIIHYKEIVKQKNEQIDLLKLNNSESYSKLDLELTKSQNEILRLNKEVSNLKLIVEGDGIPSVFNEVRKNFDNKYPIKKIKYPGRKIDYLVNGRHKEFTPNVELPNFIFDFKELRDFVKSKNLTFSFYLDRYDNNFEKAMDEVRRAIYVEITKMRNYRFDKDLFGTVEFWSGPWISYYLKVNGKRYMDCEDSSLLFMSLMKAAGVPRGFQRVVAGDTSLGGHATVHCYMFKTMNSRMTT